MPILSDSIWVIGGLLAAAVLATVGVRVVRRWFKDADPTPATGFTIGDLRQLYQDGKMTKEEFERASTLVAKAHSAQFLSPAKKDPGPLGR